MADNFHFHFKGDFFSLNLSDAADISLGDPVTLSNFCSVEVASTARLQIGNRVFFNDHCTIRSHHSISIGNDCMFGDGVRLFDFDHRYNNYHVEQFEFNTAPITIADNCWIGANTVILKGVTIGENVIVQAGCLIRQDIPANTIVFHDGNRLVYRERPQGRYHALTYTASGNLEQIETLIQALPELEFHIAAPTRVSGNITALEGYTNVSVYTQIHQQERLEVLLDRADIYLDINHLHEVSQIVHQAVDRNIPVFAFQTTSHYPEKSRLYQNFGGVEQMIKDICQLLGIKEKRKCD